MRAIRFRAWDKERNVWQYYNLLGLSQGQVNLFWDKLEHWCRYTELKDKNGLTEVYEGDIIDIDGNIIGNLYQNNELLKEATNLTIQDFGGKTWCATYKEALERGCKNA